MQSFPRIAGLFLGALLLMGSGLGLLGCQSTLTAPTSIPALPAAGNDLRTPAVVSSPSIPIPVVEATAIIAQVPSPTRGPWLTDGSARELRSPRSTPQRVNASSANSPRPFGAGDLYIHLPPQAAQRQPLRVLLVLHGMGAGGQPFAQSLLNESDRNDWLIVAPNLPYRDHMEPVQIMEDDLRITQMLVDTLDALPGQLNLKLRQHVLMYGFSRGAQLAHRFALMYPDRVESVVAMGAGTYTLPTAQNKNGKEQPTLPFPYGVGDLEKYLGRPLDWASFKNISFWVAVGEQDNRANEVPRAFDPYVGKTRVERARAFEQELRSLGMDSHLVIFPNAGHEVTPEMRKSALLFLRSDEIADNWDD